MSEESSVALDDIAELLATYRALDDKIREWEEMRGALRQRITDALRDNTIGTLAGKPYVRLSRHTQRRLSADLVKKKYPEDQLADCYTDIEVKRFSLVKS